MDRYDLNKETSLQVTIDEIIAELNKQIASLNFDLTVTKLAVQKLQNELAKQTEPDQKTYKHSVGDF